MGELLVDELLVGTAKSELSDQSDRSDYPGQSDLSIDCGSLLL